MGWHPTYPTNEVAALDMANARQVALRARLRSHYWLTDCQPITQVTVALQRRRLVLLDAADTMTDAQLAELLSPHYGFQSGPAGWTIPDLDEARRVAVESIEGKRRQAAEAGRASAAKRSGAKATDTTESGPVPPSRREDSDF